MTGGPALERLVEKVWPHEGYRTNQKEVILDALDAFYNDEFDHYILSAPTGFGKSPVCLTLGYVGGLLDNEEGGNLNVKAQKVLEGWDDKSSQETAYYVTPQNILLDQLKADYQDLPIFSMFKGRNNYTCSEDPSSSCDEGPCRFNKKMNCTRYYSAKERALSAPVTNTNFVLYMVHPEIDTRPLLVVDEAHMMPEYVQQHVEIELREDRLNQFVWDLPSFDEFEEYVEWMRPKARDLEMKAEELREKLHVQSSTSGGPSTQLVREYNQTDRLFRKFDRLVTDWGYNGEEWVVNHTSTYDERKGRNISTVKFQPITPYRFMDYMVFNNGVKTLISSATPPQPDLLGLDPDESARLTVSSPFPPENRPCYYHKIGMMGSSDREDNLPDLVDKVVDVSEGKTLLHAHTYDYAEKLHTALKDEVGDNVELQKSEHREASLEKWKRGDKDYYVSVNMYDGIDLKDDLCRTNIICVVPFPYLGDPQVQRRKEEEGDRFFNWRTAMRIQQAYGRTTRSKDDWSNTYILDSNFGWFYSQNKHLFFDWFKEALHWGD